MRLYHRSHTDYMTEQCRACGKTGSELVSWDSLWDVHVECSAEMDRRRSAGECNICGIKITHTIYDSCCEGCHFSDDVQFKGFENCHQD